MQDAAYPLDPNYRPPSVVEWSLRRVVLEGDLRWQGKGATAGWALNPSDGDFEYELLEAFGDTAGRVRITVERVSDN